MLRCREEYREFHERDHEDGESWEVSEVDDDSDDCPKCKWDEICEGGCEAEIDCGYKFELREEKNESCTH